MEGDKPFPAARCVYVTSPPSPSPAPSPAPRPHAHGDIRVAQVLEQQAKGAPAELYAGTYVFRDVAVR